LTQSQFQPVEAPALMAIAPIQMPGANFGRTSRALGYQNLTARQFAERLNLPHTWILDYSRPEFCADPIPYLALGENKRFQWGNPQLAAWIERHVVYPCQIATSDTTAFDYEYLDSIRFAERLNVSESWDRDQVRKRAWDPTPHVRFGKHIRYRWGSPELESWAERRIVCVNNGTVSRAQGKESVQ